VSLNRDKLAATHAIGKASECMDVSRPRFGLGLADSSKSYDH